MVIRFLSARVPLIKSILFLRDLKGIVARRKLKLMALVLNKLCNAENVPFRSRPKGLTGLLVLSVIIFHQVPTCIPVNIKLWDAFFIWSDYLCACSLSPWGTFPPCLCCAYTIRGGRIRVKRERLPRSN